MGQAISPDLPADGFSIERAQHRSSNAALTAAKYHKRSESSFSDFYKVEPGKVIARSKHSTVLQARGQINRRSYAVKMYRQWAMPPEAQKLLTAEVEIHLTLDHPKIVKLYDVFEAAHETVYMVMEHCEGGELFQVLTKQGSFSEAEAAEATWQMVSAVSYLHSHGIAHRDIKLDNFLYADTERKVLKLIDFGFSKVWDGRTKMQAACGTPDYVSPEVLSGDGYTPQCDMWSLGVVVFMLLSGRAPLYADQREALRQKICNGEVDWEQLTAHSAEHASQHLTRHCALSEECLDFVRSLLVVDPNRRMDAEAALRHPWLLQTEAARRKPFHIQEGICHSLRQYAYSPPLRRAVVQLVAQQLPLDQVQHLTELFLSLAKTSRGTIDLECLPELPDRDLRLLSVLDVNQDGEVYYSEFLAGVFSSLPGIAEEVLAEAFSRLDLAKTGYVGVEELWTVFGDAFEGLDAESLLGGISQFARDSEHVMDFEVFQKIVQGHGEGAGMNLEEEPCLPAFFPAPRSPSRDSKLLDKGEPQLPLFDGRRAMCSSPRETRQGALQSDPVTPCTPWPPMAPVH